METDDVAIVTLGTVLWALSLVAALVLRDRLDDQGRDSWVWVATAGLFLGLVGLRQVRRRQAPPRLSVQEPRRRAGIWPWTRG